MGTADQPAVPFVSVLLLQEQDGTALIEASVEAGGVEQHQGHEGVRGRRAEPAAEQVTEAGRLLTQVGAESMLLFSTDYPHWQFDAAPLPDGLRADLLPALARDNALQTYPRLKEAV